MSRAPPLVILFLPADPGFLLNPLSIGLPAASPAAIASRLIAEVF